MSDLSSACLARASTIRVVTFEFNLPKSPPKIKSVRIIDNPFDDIVPRITAEEKRAQQRARQSVIREREEAARRKGAKKYVSFCLRYP
jgi:hypothetical protein